MLGWAKKLKSSKFWWGQCILVMCAIFTDVWKWSQPGLQQVEKLATPLEVILSSPLTSHWKFLSVSWGWPSAMERNLPWSGLSLLIDLGLDSLRECHSSQSFCLYSYFEKGCRKKCTRQSWKALWVVLSSLFFREIWKNWHERPWKCVCEC